MVNNSAAGTAVGTVQASDQDAGQTLTYSITAGNTGNAFTINPTTGAITVATSAAISAAGTFSLTVQVGDNDLTPLATTQTVTVNVTPTNHVPVVPTQTMTVLDGSANGTAVGTVQASDQDPGETQTLTYAITGGNIGNTFAIDPATGAITVAKNTALNKSVNPTFVLTVSATDTGFPTLTSSGTVTINLLTHTAPTIAAQAFTVAETSANSTVLGTVAATAQTGLGLTYAITAGNVGNTFAIDPATGKLSVASNAVLNVAQNPTFNLTIQVTDSNARPLSSSAAVTVTVTGNHPPVINAQTFSVAQGTAVGASVGTVVATDQDPGQSLTYTMTDATGTFGITAAGVIKVANNAFLDGSHASFTVTVKATDNSTAQANSSAQITINVTTNNAPVVAPNQSFQVVAASANGTAVGTVSASDQDAGQTVGSFTITAGDPNHAFAINASTGQITVADSTQLTPNTTFNLTVQAADNATPPLTGSAVVTVVVPPVNHPPVIAAQNMSVVTGNPNGTVVGTVAATEPDAGQTLTYAITGGNFFNVFSINPQTGVITVGDNTNLVAANNPTFNLTVKVTDNGVPALSSSAVVTVNLTPNHSPTIAPQAFSVPNGSANGAPVGIVAASDVDQGQSLTYSIIGGNTGTTFAIDSGSGKITVLNNAALVPNAPAFNLTVQVTDNDTTPLSASNTITINVT